MAGCVVAPIAFGIDRDQSHHRFLADDGFHIREAVPCERWLISSGARTPSFWDLQRRYKRPPDRCASATSVQSWS
jgi:hypothetical protein